MDSLFLKKFAAKSSYTMDDLVTLVRILRDPEYGCSWDKEQTHQSVRHNFVEEVYEVLDAIDSGSSEMLCEELGDTLLQVCLHTEMEYEKSAFCFDDVCDGICKKLIYRHPHIFSDVKVDSTDEVLRNWEELKRTEKGHSNKKDAADKVARSLPALMYARKVHKTLSEKPNTEVALEDISDKLSMLKSVISKNNDGSDAVGELLFSIVALSRTLGYDAEVALMEFTNRYKGTVSDSCE